MQISTFATLLESIFEINYIQIHHTHTQDNIALSVTFIKLCRRTRSFLKKFWHCARKDRMKRMNSNFVPQTDATTFVFASLSILLLYWIYCICQIYVATDSSPVDMQSYELCCDMIDVVIDVSCIYGLGTSGNTVLSELGLRQRQLFKASVLRQYDTKNCHWDLNLSFRHAI